MRGRFAAGVAVALAVAGCPRAERPDERATPSDDERGEPDDTAAAAAPDATPRAVAPARSRRARVDAGDDPGPIVYDPLGPEPHAERRVGIEHARVETPLPDTPQVVASVEVGHPAVDRVYALAGSPGLPAWAHLSTWDPRGARDDDVRTSWRCKTTDDSHCAWMLAFEDPAQVQMLRVVVGRGRVRQVRLWTDAGYVDLPALPNAKPRWIVFEHPVPTRSVVIEATRGGSLRLDEVEVFGVAGPARAAWAFDPTAAAVTADEPWHAGEGAWHLGRYVCLAVLDERSTARCSFRGTAMYGRRGDRFALQEAIHRTDCRTRSGACVLIDRDTRRRIDVGSLAGVPSAIHLHRDGIGFASARQSGGFVAVLAEGDAIVSRRFADDAALQAAGFDPEPHTRGEFALRAPSACPEDFPHSTPRAVSTDALAVAAGRAEDDASVVDIAAGTWPQTVEALPEGAREALGDDIDGMCVDAVVPGNFDGTGLDDFVLRMHVCDDESDGRAILLLRTDLGDYLALDVPVIGTGGRPRFDQLGSGKRVLLLEEDTAGSHTVAIVEQGRGSVLQIRQRRDAGEGESVVVSRDDRGRITRIDVRRRSR